MVQTILGVAILLVGLAGVVFNERVARSYRVFTRWAFGLELSFAPDGDRAEFILVSLSFMILGLLISLHVLPVD